ncbi:MAG: hypothetical protein KDJ37_16165 [Hyphomicrobiaceae bacterium]|nr:hypothetical protein [Hyphomicrobiaceae bacterium]
MSTTASNGNGYSNSELDALEAMLGVYGGDRNRWPAAERRRFAPLVAGSKDAQRLVREAVALDSLLDAAPTVGEGRRELLADRIKAAASRTPQEAPGARLRDPAGTLWSKRAGTRVPAPFTVPPVPLTRTFPAAALLAASLVIGMFAGANGWIKPFVDQAAVVVASSEDGASSQRFSLEDLVDGSDEELL